jgi:hypothetical protein
MKKILFWVVGIVIAMQFIRPDFQNPKVDETLALSADKQAMNVLKTSCYDCHSNETKYPWYQNVAPMSWIVASNIKSGRHALNFSNWENIDAQVKLTRLTRAKQVINNGMMPKSEYLLMHENAVLDKEKREILEQFFDAEIQKMRG